MHDFYRLSFSKDMLPSAGKFYLARLQNNSTSQLYGFYDNKLYSYQYKNGTWQVLRMQDIHAQQLYFADVLGNGQDMLIAKTREGIDFYRYQDDHFELFRSSSYDENKILDVRSDYDENEDLDMYRYYDENELQGAYDWNEMVDSIKFGHFYHNTSLVGMLTKYQKDGIKFHAVMENKLLTSECPILPLGTNLTILDEFFPNRIFLS